MQKVVVCGAGFLGSNIARALVSVASSGAIGQRVQLTSRKPELVDDSVRRALPEDLRKQLVSPVPADVTDITSLRRAFENADVVVSLVGIMHGSPKTFEDVQWRGAQNVAQAAKESGARLVHISAIGADPNSRIPYERTKGLGEKAVFEAHPQATVIRPSLVFGRGDSFFARFARLASISPIMPIFGGGATKFQPVYVGDLARAVEIISKADEQVQRELDGKIVEAGGPDVFTFEQIIGLVMEYSRRKRLVISMPYSFAYVPALILEQLPQNVFTLTRAQLDQLKKDNIVNPALPDGHLSLQNLLEKYGSSPLTSVHEILPTYL